MFRPLKSRTRALTDSKGSDAFVQVSFAGATQKTSTVEHSLNPTWNQELALPVTLPAIDAQPWVWAYYNPNEIARVIGSRDAATTLARAAGFYARLLATAAG